MKTYIVQYYFPHLKQTDNYHRDTEEGLKKLCEISSQYIIAIFTIKLKTKTNETTNKRKD